ncbi:hypothetical protein BY996DRAFT_6605599 [Phakopsora pachyrhizi]|nr:hypothetical protein BY996DRAFT_6605599 [Phakopsora pachyrhizi]
MNTSVIKPSRLLLLGLKDLTRWHLYSSAEGQVIWTYNSSPGRELGEQTFETKVTHSRQPRMGLNSTKSFTTLTAIGGKLFCFVQSLSQNNSLIDRALQVELLMKIILGLKSKNLFDVGLLVPDHDYEGRLGYWTVALTESRGVSREVHLVGINIELEKVVVFQVS